LRVASRLLGDPLLAEDVAQEAMVRAWRQAAHYDPARARFTTWLYRIIVNLCIDERRRIRTERMPEDFDCPDPGASADELLEVSEREVMLTNMLNTLPVRQRAAMTLVYDEGVSGIEAAGILGVSTKAVERLLARARAYLREHLRTVLRDNGSPSC
jgi:RNA polymerase sigma-70 factor (ECF subfamily)